MSSIVKRCSVAIVLALAALMPDYRLVKTSAEGLAIIANLEGCRLNPYQCSAGVWTSGIGHTAGVKPAQNITEQDAARNLIADIIMTERAVDKCMPVTMPQPVYDAVISLAFNIGTGAACNSRLANFIRHGEWSQACQQLPRWVYVNGVWNKGLNNRRAVELKHCMKGVP
ncbi:lysozyme [Rahnella sp. JUb53]|uniref:lysozyme n=1 Tax=Rahnella sp. JUb53 TaxID=2485128 RepID=UPI00104DF664|nr:lysozyme [Rahnella sp. JUb53]TCQ89231.1 lysozyme [Rahnella sp. JUb53]